MNNSPGKTVLVSGGTGFVGRFIVRELLANGHVVRVLGRSQAGATQIPPEAEYVQFDITREDELESAAEGCNAVIHLVGILQEDRGRGVTFEATHTAGTRNLVGVAARAGVSSFIHMSANGARADGVSRYQSTKWEAEEIVRKAGFDSWTVFRPSLIFGKPGEGCPEFCTRLVDTMLKPLPVWPVFGDGKYRLQPISVQDVARAFVQAVSSTSHSNRTYCLAGPGSFTYLEILDIMANAAGLKIRPKLHQPVWFARSAIKTVGALGVLPITLDQFEMLIEGNTCDNSRYERDFGVAPAPFDGESLKYLRERG